MPARRRSAAPYFGASGRPAAEHAAPFDRTGSLASGPTPDVSYLQRAAKFDSKRFAGPDPHIMAEESGSQAGPDRGVDGDDRDRASEHLLEVAQVSDWAPIA